MAGEWKYVRTNSKGKRIFRRDTNESIDFVTKYLDDNNIDYEIKSGATMMYIYDPYGKLYAYYWTTGRWSADKAIADRHYNSEGIEDFVTKYVGIPAEEKQVEE
tara:strand:- start:4414 stop:4725 length:312 start_codon:yes stop_codon:yes gene_type:complete